MASAGFLPPDQAFEFKAESVSKDQAKLHWAIAPHYYLYHDQFKVAVEQQPLKLKLPQGKDKDDPTFGLTEVHYNQVSATLQVKPDTQYQVSWQGCSEDGLCYPVQRTTLTTDTDGLLPQVNLSKSSVFQAATDPAPKETALPQPKTKTLTDATAAPAPLSQPEAAAAPESAIATTDNPHAPAELVAPSSTQRPALAANTAQSASAAPASWSSQWNNDQAFLNLFSQNSWLINLFIFFIFGVLLAFLPCSLPLIPILSGIIVQRKKGYRAVPIAATFVISMAAVYALMGGLVGGIGYSFQRWFQSPGVIIGFALLFVVFAFNLLGFFQLSLPQSILQRLDRLQNRQAGGTIYGAAVMGVLSALIVGPCMSAPLAGSLLFVSQTQSPALGGIYLFMLGLGMGLPLFIAAVFGARFLPKPGIWMERLKFSFGFVMLMMALYFVRPLLSFAVYHGLFGLLLLALALYLFWLIRQQQQTALKILTFVLAGLLLAGSVWNFTTSFNSLSTGQHASSLHSWQTVRSADELHALLAQARQQQRPVVLDVYADWCVACQPIERDIMPRSDVQTALEPWYRVKLDLTEYQPSQDQILAEREILGPPTVLFLDPAGQELRSQRLTGTFSAEQLINRLQQQGR